MRKPWVVAAVAASCVLAGAPVRAGEQPPLLAPPVDGGIGRRFEAPLSSFGPGHRGIDYVVPAGTPVRAAAPGRVVFSGSVAGVVAVTLAHEGGLRTTYSRLARTLVAEGDLVGQGHLVGLSSAAHPGSDGLHFGVKLDGSYVDPEVFLGPLDAGAAVHLAPLAMDVGGALTVGLYSRAHAAPCAPRGSLTAARRPPNDNVAIAVAGIGSSTDGAAIYPSRYGPESLGYPSERVYRFSYRGPDGVDLHERYGPEHTFGDIRAAAARLRTLLERVGERHPGAGVDIFAHSQGGVVARAMLEGMAASWQPGLPRVEHLVTYGSPHLGAPLAGEVRDLRDRTETGRGVLRALSWSARHGGGLPDPTSPAVAQLEPGSDLMAALAREDVAYGTRVLALAMPHDLVVPATRARFPGKPSHILSPEGLDGHGAVVRSPRARALAHAFVRDAAGPCLGPWDGLGSLSGGTIEWLQERIDGVYGGLELAGTGPAIRATRWALGRVGDVARGVRAGLRRVRGGLGRVGRLVVSGLPRLWPRPG